MCVVCYCRHATMQSQEAVCFGASGSAALNDPVATATVPTVPPSLSLSLSLPLRLKAGAADKLTL